MDKKWIDIDEMSMEMKMDKSLNGHDTIDRRLGALFRSYGRRKMATSASRSCAIGLHVSAMYTPTTKPAQ